MAVALVMVGLVFLVIPQPLRWFDAVLAFSMFFNIAVPAFVYIMALLFIQIVRTKRQSLQTMLAWSLATGLRVWLVFYVSLVIKYNLKTMAGVWNPTLHDQALYQFDRWLAPTVSWLVRGLEWFDQIYDLAPWYALVYQFLFLLTFIIASYISPRIFRELFAATIILLFLGVIGYLLLPAVGPFIFKAPHSPYQQLALQQMFFKYTTYVNSGGVNYIPSYLTQALAAMPSLHVAYTSLFVYFIWRQARSWLIVYLPLALFIVVEALYTKFHYLLDLIVGAELAAIAIILAHWIYVIRDHQLAQAVD